jgi:hypothetical protein
MGGSPPLYVKPTEQPSFKKRSQDETTASSEAPVIKAAFTPQTFAVPFIYLSNPLNFAENYIFLVYNPCYVP